MRRQKRTQLDFIQFYRVLSEVQPKFEAALLEAGATPALLAQTSILYAQIEQANTTQEVFKKQRLQKTAYRVENVNALYLALRARRVGIIGASQKLWGSKRLHCA